MQCTDVNSVANASVKEWPGCLSCGVCHTFVRCNRPKSAHSSSYRSCQLTCCAGPAPGCCSRSAGSTAAGTGVTGCFEGPQSTSRAGQAAGIRATGAAGGAAAGPPAAAATCHDCAAGAGVPADVCACAHGRSHAVQASSSRLYQP